MTVLGILWFILIAVLIAGYFILDGFDLGSGVLSPFVAKDEKEKAIVRRSICASLRHYLLWLLFSYHAGLVWLNRACRIA